MKVTEGHDEGHFAPEVSLRCFTESRCADAGRRVAEADLKHVPVSDRPTTYIHETRTYLFLR